MTVSTMGVGINQSTGQAQEYVPPNVRALGGSGGIGTPTVGPPLWLSQGETIPAGIWLCPWTTPLVIPTDSPLSPDGLYNAGISNPGFVIVSDGSILTGNFSGTVPLYPVTFA